MKKTLLAATVLALSLAGCVAVPVYDGYGYGGYGYGAPYAYGYGPGVAVGPPVVISGYYYRGRYYDGRYRWRNRYRDHGG